LKKGSSDPINQSYFYNSKTRSLSNDSDINPEILKFQGNKLLFNNGNNITSVE
jgi:hypothetical protein